MKTRALQLMVAPSAAAWLILLVIAGGPAAAQTSPSARQALQELSDVAAGTQDVVADFEQQRFSRLLKKPLVSSGQVLVKGGRVRWEAHQPRPSSMLVEGTTIRTHYPVDKKLEIYELSGRGPSRIVELAFSPVPRPDLVLEHFHVELLEESAGAVRFRLSPKNASMRQHLREVVVSANAQTGLAHEVQWTDGGGDRTTITFRTMRINTGLTDGQLDLEIPPGTKLVRRLGGKGGGSGTVTEGGKR